jgi:dTDP-4-amino-4,6-dideoxygalactose transaminase
MQYGRQSISDEDIVAVSEVLTSDWLTIGPEVDRFESKIASVANTKYSVAVSSGTAALHCAYKALNLKPGDEVITTPLTFVATSAMAAMFGAKIVFADVEDYTGNIDSVSVESLITDRTKVIAGVDFAGHPIDIDELSRIAKLNGIYLLEDAAHSIGGFYKQMPIGSQADITTFSFFPTKNLTTGEGGAIVTNSAELFERAKKFKMHGLVREPENMRYPNEGPWHQEVHDFGLNYRLPDILATLGSSQLERLTQFKNRRAEIYQRYVSELANLDWVTLPGWKPNVDPMWHLFPIRVPAGVRKSLLEYLRKHDVMVQVNYIPVYWHPVFEDLGYKRGLCPVAEEYYRGEISLPIHPGITHNDQTKVIDLLMKFADKNFSKINIDQC